MAEDEKSTYGVAPRLVQEFIGQLQAITGKLGDLAGSGPGLLLALGAFPLPGGLSSAQTKSITEIIASQRLSIVALKTQLSSYDEQLGVLDHPARSPSGAGPGPILKSGAKKAQRPQAEK